MVDAEQHGTWTVPALGAGPRRAREKPDQNLTNHPDDDIEGVTISLVLRRALSPPDGERPFSFLPQFPHFPASPGAGTSTGGKPYKPHRDFRTGSFTIHFLSPSRWRRSQASASHADWRSCRMLRIAASQQK